MPETPRRSIGLQRPMALAVAILMLLPVLAISTATPANAAQLFHRNPADSGKTKPGMSTGKKVALVAGAALLYYLYRRHVAAQAAQQKMAETSNQAAPAAPAVATQHAQLYRSRNGGVYYRDPQGKPVWLTVPSQPVQVSVDDLQRYAPDYNKYAGPAPAVPSGYRTQRFSDFSPADTSGVGAGQ